MFKMTDKELNLLNKTKIGVAGLGGLGSNTTNNLVRLGFTNFVLVDFDKIEVSNLNRQFYFNDQVGEFKSIALKKNLLRINPNLNIEEKNIYLTKDNIEEIFKECDIVVEGFDKANSKIMFIEVLSGLKQCVCATGLGHYWNVEGIKSKKVNKNLIIVGDFISDTDNGGSALCPGVSIASGKQAASVLYLTLGGNDEFKNY